MSEPRTPPHPDEAADPGRPQPADADAGAPAEASAVTGAEADTGASAEADREADTDTDAGAGAEPGVRPARRLPRRLVQLYAGIALFGASCAMMVRANLGLAPWDVLHQGLSRHTGLSIGTVSITAGVVVLLLWLPLRQRPGLGTVSNALLVGLAIDATLRLLPAERSLPLRAVVLVAGVVLNGLATGLYISARFGPGPRDGLMTGLHRRTGRSVRLMRTGIEVAVLAAGLLLGGSAGVGTVLYAVAIGPLAQFALRRFDPDGRRRGRVVARGPLHGARRTAVRAGRVILRR